MQIEIGINPNCSEAVMRLNTKKLTGEQEQELYSILEKYVGDYNYETFISRNKVFGIPCIVIDGDAPYNDRNGIDKILDKLSFINKVTIEMDEK